jgi:hypothetical protein
MMKLPMKNRFCQLLLAGAAATPTLTMAQVEDEQVVRFGGTLYAEMRYLQNASRTPIEEQEVDEAQARYGANLMASIERELVELAADYNLYQNEYAENTQQDRFIRTGQSSIVVGTEKTFYQLEAAHSTQRFLANPAGPTILSNTDQRDITTVSPLLRLQPGHNSISVVGHYADIRYKEMDNNDSERIGAGITLLRKASPIYTYGLSALENHVDFAVGDAADYKYRKAAFVFDAQLRLLRYEIEVGANEAVPDSGPSVDALYYDLSFVYGRYRNSWQFTAERNITDTSLGNANDPFFSEGITSDVSTVVQDHLERRSFGFIWRSDFLCERCDVSLRAGYEDERYFEITTEDEEEVFGGVALGYRLRPSITLDVLLDHRQRDFADGGRNADYDESALTVALDTSEIFRYLTARYWVRHERRDPISGNGYSTNAVGVTLAYEFGY